MLSLCIFHATFINRKRPIRFFCQPMLPSKIVSHFRRNPLIQPRWFVRQYNMKVIHTLKRLWCIDKIDSAAANSHDI